MLRKEFKNYVKSYCAETGALFPAKCEELFCEFSKINYSEKTDMEVALWEFLDDNVLKIKKDNMQLTNLVCCIEAAPCPQPKCWPKACNKEEGNTQMNTQYNETEANRKYLNARINNAQYVKSDELHKLFNMRNASVPSDYKTLIDAIKNDKYEIDKKAASRVDAFLEEEERYYGSPFEGIKFKLDNAPDTDGYHGAEKAAEKQMKAAKDVINTADAAAGLKALQDYEAWLPTPAVTTTSA